MRVSPRVFLNRIVVFAAVFVALASGASLCVAQQPQPAAASTAAAQQTGPTIRAQTHAILISVAVKDAGGHAVPGLQTRDFTITDNDRPRDFVMFPIDNSPTAPASAPVTHNGFFSNENEPAAPSGRKIAILIDAVNTAAKDQSYAREKAITAIQKAELNADIAVYAMGPDLQVLQDYTRDRDALITAVRNFRPSPPRWHMPASQSVASPYSAEYSTIGGGGQTSAAPKLRMAMASFFLQRRIEATSQALLAIATHMSSSSHRNSIIWITAGFVTNVDTNEQVQTAIAAVNDANVAIYPVDARGLLPTGIDGNVMVLRGIAHATGGDAYTARNDLDRSIEDAIADQDSTYLLGFYLAQGELDGKFHKLHVSVDRPGLQLNYRSGYTASPDPNTRRQDAEPMEAELLATHDASGIGFDAQVTRQHAAGGDSFRVYVVLDPDTVPKPGAKSNGKVILDELFAELDAHGKVIGKVTADVTFDPPTPGTKAGYPTIIHAQDGAKELRIILQDKVTKQTGSLRLPLTGIPGL